VEIRPLRPSDAPAVAAFFASAHRADPAVEFVPVGAWRAFVAYPANRRGRDFRLAWKGGRVTGVLTSTLLEGTRHGRRRRHFRIVVHPEARGGGVGSALLEAVEAQPVPPPRPTLQTLVPGSWAVARAFLGSRGFHEVHRDVEMRRGGLPVPAPEPPPGVLLRPFGRAGDEAAWPRLHAEAYRGAFHFEPLARESVRAERRAPGALVRVAEARGRPVGIVLARDHGDGGAAIQSLITARRWRRRGVGRALLRDALGALRARGRRRTTLGVDAGNAGAIALYASEGFVPAREDVTLWKER
jgi:mycothiol synthase